MPVKVTLDAVLTANKVTAKAIAEQIGISETQLSQFRSGKVRGLRFSAPDSGGVVRVTYPFTFRPQP